MNPNGSGLTNLTIDPAWDISPAGSPDGRKIAFSTNRGGDWEIFVMNADGSGPRNLTPQSGNGSWASLVSCNGRRWQFPQTAHGNVQGGARSRLRTNRHAGRTIFLSVVADPPFSSRSLRRLQRLLANREQAARRPRKADDEFARAIVDVRDREGVSVRVLADALQIGASTVQDWTRRGRQLLG
jgi:hypothetical protein